MAVFALLLLVLPPFSFPFHRRRGSRRQISVISKRYLKSTRCTASHTVTQPSPGTIGRNELDTHTDTCCAGANWKLMELTSEVCNVSPFLNTYAPVKEIPVGRCCTVWTCNNTGREVLLAADHMLWFGSQMEHSLINPNQIHEYGLPVFDNPFDTDSYAPLGMG